MLDSGAVSSTVTRQLKGFLEHGNSSSTARVRKPLSRHESPKSRSQGQRLQRTSRRRSQTRGLTRPVTPTPVIHNHTDTDYYSMSTRPSSWHHPNQRDFASEVVHQYYSQHTTREPLPFETNDYKFSGTDWYTPTRLFDTSDNLDLAMHHHHHQSRHIFPFLDIPAQTNFNYIRQSHLPLQQLHPAPSFISTNTSNLPVNSEGLDQHSTTVNAAAVADDELIGLGLYDDNRIHPSTQQSLLFSSSVPQTRRGLVLEDAWEPPPSQEDYGAGSSDDDELSLDGYYQHSTSTDSHFNATNLFDPDPAALNFDFETYEDFAGLWMPEEQKLDPNLVGPGHGGWIKVEDEDEGLL